MGTLIVVMIGIIIGLVVFVLSWASVGLNVRSRRRSREVGVEILRC